MNEDVQIRVHGDSSLPTLIYLPGLHGDWTLVTAFRMALTMKVRFVEITYPESTTGTIEEYARMVNKKLLSLEIASGWLLGESFGSQIAWALLELNTPPESPAHERCFRADGLILAGGFVKHPWKWGPSTLLRIGKLTPTWLYRLGLKAFMLPANIFHRNNREVLESLREFAKRRTANDRLAMQSRLAALEQFDACHVARQTRLPVYFLDGLIDPLVPSFQVLSWLRKNCPGYKRGRILWCKSHNVLHGSPIYYANHIVNWMKMPLS